MQTTLEEGIQKVSTILTLALFIAAIVTLVLIFRVITKLMDNTSTESKKKHTTLIADLNLKSKSLIVLGWNAF